VGIIGGTIVAASTLVLLAASGWRQTGLRNEVTRLDRVPTPTSTLLRTNRHIGLYIDSHILDGKPLTTLRAVPRHENLVELGHGVGMALPGFIGECDLIVAPTIAIAKVHCYRRSRLGRDSRSVYSLMTATVP
jgi:hypothetical protein